jgi:DNA repair photolyase
MMMAIRFGKVKDYADWRKPKLVENALELLDEELPKQREKINFVHLCFTTDPFMQGYPEVSEMSLKIIQKLNDYGVRSTVLTKGLYPKALINREKYGFENEYGITLVSLDDKFKKIYEPFSASFSARIQALEYLHDNGLKTWVSMEPYPTPNLVDQDLEDILESISFTDKIVFGKLNYNVKSNTFKDNEVFYENCAKEVVNFCKKEGITHHIKFGTRQRDIPQTATIFNT